MSESDDLQYYCYTVPQGAACVRFHLEPLDGDLNLYIRNARSELPLRPQPGGSSTQPTTRAPTPK